MNLGTIKLVACGLAFVATAALPAWAQDVPQPPSQQSACLLRPQFVTPRFIQPNFSKNIKELPDFEPKDPYRPEFVHPNFIAPEYIRAQYVPRQYLGCVGYRFVPAKDGFKVEYQAIEPATSTAKTPGEAAPAPAPEAKAEVTMASAKPATSYQYTLPPKADNCCGGDIKLPAAPATPTVLKEKIN